MDNLNEKQRDILQCISTAFATVPYPGDDGIIGHECSECERANAVFRGKHWKDYLYSPYELLGYFAPQQPTIMFSRDSLCLLQPKAFLFFLPVFLAGIVIDSKQADVMVDAMPGQFDPGPTSRCKPDLWTWKKNRCEQVIKLMNEEQRQAVILALQYAAPNSDQVPPTTKDAIENLKAGSAIAWGKYDATTKDA